MKPAVIRRAALGALAVATLLPISVDQALAVEIRGYSLRANYFPFALLILALGFEALRKPATGRALKALFRAEKFWWAFLALGLCGAIGAAGSVVPTRSWVFLIWTVGTLTALPAVVWYLYDEFGPWLPRALGLYHSLSSTIILADSVLCNLPSRPSIGRRQIVPPDGCRPFAFYQEPNYFAAFSLLVLVALRLAAAREKDPRWRKGLWACFAIGAAATLICTSKLGLLGLVGFALVEGFRAIRLKPSRTRVRSANWTVVLPAAGILLALLGSWVVARNPYIRRTYYEATHLTALGGTDFRTQNALAALDLVRDRPFFGVGPGAAGAYSLDNAYRLPTMKAALDGWTPERQEYARHSPLFYNVYSETAAEWGLLGLLCLFVGWGLLLRRLPVWDLLLAGGILIAVGTTWQTLPRFDLWAALALIGCLSRVPISKPR